MHTAGNDIDQSIGMIVAANDVAQNPESVGNAMKVVSLRIRGATTELEAMGENADGAAKSTAKLQAEIKALSGVDIMKSKTEFKAPFEIMDELADKWSSLNDISRASILEDLAGKNRANVVSGMLENWEDARKAADTARESFGSASLENSKFLDSVQGRLSRFQATFQSFSTDLLDSSLVKAVIDLGTAAMNTADNFVKWGEAMPAIAAGISGIVTGMGGTGGMNMPFYAVGIAV